MTSNYALERSVRGWCERAAGAPERAGRAPRGPLNADVRHRMKSSVAVMCLTALTMPSHADDWRLATRDQILPDWADIPGVSVKNQVSADFDGNGVVDIARIMVSKIDGQLMLFVMMNEDSEDFRLLQLQAMTGLGIDLVAPGTYKTTCGKGYYDCADGETEEVTLQRHGLSVFKWESASSILYWDDATQAFKSFTDSD